MTVRVRHEKRDVEQRVKIETVESGEIGCRSGCGACCIAPSISSPMPKMPHGKKAGERCLHLLPDLRCELFGLPERPAVCVSLRPEPMMCGRTREEAMSFLMALELATSPQR